MGLAYAGAAAAESAWEPVAPAGLPAALAPEGGALPFCPLTCSKGSIDLTGHVKPWTYAVRATIFLLVNNPSCD